jgi:hypothetical protein
MSRGTANVVVKRGTPIYISDDLEAAQDVARDLDAEYDSNVDLWKNVTYDIEVDDE